MIATYFCVLFALQLLHYSHALQTGFTCETSVTLTCPRGRKLVVLEVTYSSECPRVADEVNGTSLYAPSRCVGYFRERASNDCNGEESCVVDNSLDQRPSFLPGKQANCGFKGQSVNIDYSCVPDFYSSKLPRVDICSMHSLDEIKEGFIHTPNYPETYPNDRKCEKKVPEPDAGHRLKIYIIDLDVEGVTSSRAMNDWLEINDNGERLYGAREPYTLIFDDVIEANLNFKSNAANGKRAYRGALLYFIVAPMRRPRPPTTTTTEEPINLLQGKALAFTNDRRPTSNVFLVLLVVLLSSVLLLTITGFLLYQRRNDRRIRYLTEMFSSFMPKGSKSAVVDSSEPSDDSHIKFDLSSSSHDEKPVVKHTRIDVPDSEHIYSQDPLTKASENALIYDYIDDDAIYQQVVKPTPKL